LVRLAPHTEPLLRAGNGNLAGKAVKEAIEVGYRHIDCAAVYGNEKEVGAALKECIDAGLVTRGDLFVTSKLWNTDHRRVEEACRRTLSDLGLEYLDLYLVHFPLAFEGKPGGEAPGYELDETGKAKMCKVSLQDTWREMERLVDSGLVRSIGVSNYEFLTFNDALAYARIPPACNQIEAHPYFAVDWFVKYCQSKGVVVVAHTPLGGAVANDKWRSSGASPLEDATIAEVASAHGVTPAQTCLRWGIDRGCVVIPKSTKRHRLEENFDVFGFSLSPEEVDRITAGDKDQRSNKSGTAWGIQFRA
jgi:diketogulonate reductase-like aldo/keto reductase